MNPFDGLHAAAARLTQAATSSREKNSVLVMTEAAAAIRSHAANIQAALEATAGPGRVQRPKFKLLAGDETPRPKAVTRQAKHEI
jgi:hypothetical protein